MVSIAAFQAVDPGSIPGRRNLFLSQEVKIYLGKVFQFGYVLICYVPNL